MVDRFSGFRFEIHGKVSGEHLLHTIVLLDVGVIVAVAPLRIVADDLDGC